MHCPFCAAVETKVIDSRLASEGEQVRRRRECIACGERFTTFETAELAFPRIIKRDGTREAYDPDKLRAGLQLAVRKRAVETARIDAAVRHIERRLREASGEREVDARQLGAWVMEELRRIDQVAYVRFASVYLSFEDVQAFRDLVEKLEGELSPEQHNAQVPLIPDEEPG